MFSTNSAALVTCLMCTLLFAISCDDHTHSSGELSEDPQDLTVAVYQIEDGEGSIRVAKLHLKHFHKLCVGDYPSVSPSGRFVAYNQSLSTGIHPVRVIEIQTGEVRTFDSIPKDLAPWPESFWSRDESLIAFHVHDFTGNKSRCVVSMLDGSFWRGTDVEFHDKYQGHFGSTTLCARESGEGRLTIKNFNHVGALYFRADNGDSIRLTPEDMGVASPPIWIERTGEALFIGRRVRPPYRDEDVMPGNVYLIKPEAKDWANVSTKEWHDAIVTMGEQVSASR